MPYFRATDSRTGAVLGDIEADTPDAAAALAQRNWGNPGEPPVAVPTEYTPAALFLVTIVPALRDNGLSSEERALWVGNCEGDDELEGVGDRKDAVFIYDLVVSEPGQGIGARLIRVLTRHADALGVAVYLNPWASKNSDGGLDQEALEAWYKRHGWDWMDGINHVMVREPARLGCRV